MLTILALAGGVAYVVTLFGLTASLGAFVAGLVVAAGDHRERATRSILAFQLCLPPSSGSRGRWSFAMAYRPLEVADPTERDHQNTTVAIGHALTLVRAGARRCRRS